MSHIVELPPVERPAGNSKMRPKPDRASTGSWDLDACTHVPGREAKTPPGKVEIPEDVNRARVQLMAATERAKLHMAQYHSLRARKASVLEVLKAGETTVMYAAMVERLKGTAMQGYMRATPRNVLDAEKLSGLAVDSTSNKIKAVQD